MLMDEAIVTFKGGHGGAGIVSFGPKEGSGPDGGNGGRGGDLYIVAKNDITLLNQFKAAKPLRGQSSFQAGDAAHGGKNKQTGKDGKDVDIYLPVGTTLIDQTTGEEILELTEVDQRILLCAGGKGGKGNYEFRSPRRTTPKFAQSGLPGEEKIVKLNLKLIADFGLIGLPNAGKSSLLNELTNAHAKTANYAFTTLSPNLGVINGKILADIPGLIEGAHEGRGLGIKFLKHIEKVETLLHCIAADSDDYERDYNIVRRELGEFNSELLKKKEIILITKSDLGVKEKLQAGKKAIHVSIHDYESLEGLKKILVS